MRATIASVDRTTHDSLASSAAAGDEDAFAMIMAEHAADMERVAFTVCGEVDLAREAVASAWPKAWRGLKGIRDDGRLRPWLVAIAANEARQLLRARRRRTVVELRAASGPGESEDHPTAAIDRLDLERALARLEPSDRALLALRYVAGLSSQELASVTGLSANGVRSRLARLVARIRTELDDG
jgi:RNA polymerase sigma-70 factor (ECF subfamily)